MDGESSVRESENERPVDEGPTIEDVKTFWDARPCNIRHSPMEVGSKEFFDQVEARKYFVEPHIPGFADFPRWRGKRVLEIGCGIGTDAVNFARNGAEYFGVDVSKESLELARRRFDVFDLSGRFFEGNAENVTDLLDGAELFDLIYSFGVIHHTPDPLAVLVSARTHCHPGTQLQLMVYARNSWKSAMIEAGLDQPEAQYGCPIAGTYTEGDVAALLSEAGFRLTDIRQDHIFPYQVEAYRNYEYQLQPWFESMEPRMFKALEKTFGWHLLVTAVPC